MNILDLKTQLMELSQKRGQLSQQAVLAKAQLDHVHAELNYVTGQCVLLQDLIHKQDCVTPKVTDLERANGATPNMVVDHRP